MEDLMVLLHNILITENIIIKKNKKRSKNIFVVSILIILYILEYNKIVNSFLSNVMQVIDTYTIINNE